MFKNEMGHQAHLLSPVLKIKVITSLVMPLENFPTTMESLIVLKYSSPTMCQNVTKNSDKEHKCAIRSRVFASV
jgi:hypothetical protein